MYEAHFFISPILPMVLMLVNIAAVIVSNLSGGGLLSINQFVNFLNPV
jgi:hypothetical protein